MRRLPALLSAIALIAVCAACSAGSAPGWTYAPAPSATPAASGSASGAPGASSSAGASAPASGSPSGAPSSAPSTGASAAPSGAAGSVTISAPVGAATTGFQPTTAETAANKAFELVFDNQDNQAPHNLVLLQPDGSKVAVQGDTAFFQGPAKKTFEVPALPAGAYPFKCEVHPTTMTGTLTVK
jgi:plastocyanin